MRCTPRLFVSSILVLLATAATFDSTALGADAPQAPAVAISPAEPLVQQALKAEVAGNASERTALLDRAIAADPDYAPAHWHKGEVRAKSRWTEGWKPVDEAAAEMARAGKVEQYRGMNPAARRSWDQERKIGEWCAEAGLDSQARMHLMTALRLRPNLRAVQTKLGVVRFNGGFAAPEDVEQVKRQQLEYAATLKSWRHRLEKLRVDVNTDSPNRQSIASRELSAIGDPLAIAAMEELSVDGGSVFGIAIVEAFTTIPEQQATNALVRQAVCSQYGDVRQAASLALKDRSIFGYVPTLMGALQAPIRFRMEQWSENGQSFHQLKMFQEGPLAAQAFTSSGGDRIGDTVITKFPVWKLPDLVGREYSPDATLAQDYMKAKRAAAYNAQAEAWNANALAAMSIATGVQLGYEPTAWWNWWLNYNEIYVPPVKPVVVGMKDTTPPGPSSQVRVNYASCFIAGTKVWAMDGPMPIEKVRVGEWLLAQNPASGELAYKPVVGTTIRPPSPVRAIKIKEDTIVATRGHPFWVTGKGWQMTKELNPGQLLHTIHGSVDILDAEYIGEAVCYNLVVADFGTYFVGEKKVLVHDNHIRDVSPAIVPGLITR